MIFFVTYAIGMNRNYEYVQLPLCHDINETCFKEVKKHFDDGTLKFYFAIQNKGWKGCFFVINPELFKNNSNSDHIRYMIFNAINENRLFQAVIFDQGPVFAIPLDLAGELHKKIYLSS